MIDKLRQLALNYALIAGLGAMTAATFAPSAALAQDRKQTLADIRQELSVLYVEVQRLKRELSTTGAPNLVITGNTPQERLDAIEAALQQLTAETENLQLRVRRIVKDGTNRIGDLEFRLVELEGGDTSKLGETTTLGGDMAGAGGNTGADIGAGSGGVAPQGGNDSADLAVGERADFDHAKAALDAGKAQQAADLFATYIQTYPGGALSAQAHFLRGTALEKLGQTADAARAYLKSFSGDPKGPDAPKALFRLGRALGELGQTKDACVTLAEVQPRFPASPMVLEAGSQMRNLGCE